MDYNRGRPAAVLCTGGSCPSMHGTVSQVRARTPRRSCHRRIAWPTDHRSRLGGPRRCAATGSRSSRSAPCRSKTRATACCNQKAPTLDCAGSAYLTMGVTASRRARWPSGGRHTPPRLLFSTWHRGASAGRVRPPQSVWGPQIFRRQGMYPAALGQLPISIPVSATLESSGGLESPLQPASHRRLRAL